MKHTPGPWSINTWEHQGDASMRIGAKDTPMLTRVSSEFVSINEWRANAKLIAAAPEMFEALQSVNNYFIDLQNKCALTNPDKRAWKLVSKAINKAIG